MTKNYVIIVVRLYFLDWRGENINIFDLAVVLTKNYVIIVVRLYFLDWRGENGNLS